MVGALPKYVRVTPELSFNKQFDYSVPEALQEKIGLGFRLRVPWGTKTILAYAVDFPETPEVEKCRDVIEVLGERPLIPSSLCQLAKWMAEYYCCEFSLALKNMLPEAVRSREDGHKKRLWVCVPEHLDEKVVLDKLSRAAAQRKAWLHVRDVGGGWLSELCSATSTGQATWRALADRGYVSISQEKMERNPLAGGIKATAPHSLNREQASALSEIVAAMDEPVPRPVLLKGVTGSGKTEVYLRALAEVLDRGKSALVLVPEIALTPQTVEQFRARFEGERIRVAVLHSHLSSGERHDQWQQIRSGTARVVIGARSAVFAPLMEPGLIVVDEEHESSYKQEETPHYHARDLAVMRGRLERVPVVLGSATPSLESLYNVEQGKYRMLTLSERVDSQPLPLIHVVDMRRERVKSKEAVALGEMLCEAVEKRLASGKQAILFINRRGFATTVQCPSCGRVEECPHCAVPLTFHRTDRKLHCHLCGFVEEVPQECPDCKFSNYKYSGMGTQKVEDMVARAFPTARWQRMDSDSMRGKHAYQKALSDFREGRTDLLVGTQMIAKGLHFPNVTCVGVVQVDNALQIPDFRASERVFQLLVQVAGRAGRGGERGEVFIQTYTPFHPAIQFARHHDVEGFIEQEMEYRQAHDYPPYTRAVLITFRGRMEDKTEFCIGQAAKKIRTVLPPDTEMSDPAPAPIAKLQDYFRFQIFLRTRRVLELSRVLKREVVEMEWPEGVRSTVNVDPVNLL